MSLWCLMAAPLFFSGDMQLLDDFTLNVLCNAEAIEVNQDPLGRQAKPLVQNDETLIMAKPMEDGSLAVGLFNLAELPRKVSVDWSLLGLHGRQRVPRSLAAERSGPVRESLCRRCSTSWRHAGSVLAQVTVPGPQGQQVDTRAPLRGKYAASRCVTGLPIWSSHGVATVLQMDCPVSLLRHRLRTAAERAVILLAMAALLSRNEPATASMATSDQGERIDLGQSNNPQRDNAQAYQDLKARRGEHRLANDIARRRLRFLVREGDFTESARWPPLPGSARRHR